MKSFVFVLILILSAVSLPAQQLTNVSAADTNSVAANSIPAGQAPDDVIKKLSNLVHDGKYAEAQQLASGLLLAYPDDQRLIKAKTLLDKLIAASNDSQPTNSVAQPAASGTSEQLTGMDKVEYNSLIEMAKEAQQNTDLDQQKASLKQFMDESSIFLQKYPDQMLLWQIRAASALILDDSSAGYEAGQKLLTGGAADSNDPNFQQLISKLKIKGWLDKQNVEAEQKQKDKKNKFGWLLGTWKVQWKWKIPYAGDLTEKRDYELFSLSDSTIEGYVINYNGAEKAPEPDLRGVILDTGEIKWDCYLIPYNPERGYIFRYKGNGWTGYSYFGGNIFYNASLNREEVQAGPFSPSGWQSVISFEADQNSGEMRMIIPSQNANAKSDMPLKYPVTLIFTKTDGSQSQQVQPQ
jgi:hypothetical protein